SERLGRLAGDEHRTAGQVRWRPDPGREGRARALGRDLVPLQAAVGVLVDLDQVAAANGDVALTGPGPRRLVLAGGQGRAPVPEGVDDVPEVGAGELVTE